MATFSNGLTQAPLNSGPTATIRNSSPVAGDVVHVINVGLPTASGNFRLKGYTDGDSSTFPNKFKAYLRNNVGISRVWAVGSNYTATMPTHAYVVEFGHHIWVGAANAILLGAAKAAGVSHNSFAATPAAWNVLENTLEAWEQKDIYFTVDVEKIAADEFLIVPDLTNIPNGFFYFARSQGPTPFYPGTDLDATYVAAYHAWYIDNMLVSPHGSSGNTGNAGAAGTSSTLGSTPASTSRAAPAAPTVRTFPPSGGGSILLLHSDADPPPQDTAITPQPSDFLTSGTPGATANPLTFSGVTNNSLNTIYYFLMDAAQNISYHGNISFYNDQTPPVVIPDFPTPVAPYTGIWLGPEKLHLDGSIEANDSPT